MPAQRHPSSLLAPLIALAILGFTAYTFTDADAAGAPSSATVQPGTFAGLAFDACAAPSNAEMAAWKAHSPYRAIGIYIGGIHRG